MNDIPSGDMVRLLLLEAAVHHLFEARVLDEERVLEELVAELTADLDDTITDDESDAGAPVEAAPSDPLDEAYRCLAALRRIQLGC